MHFFLLFSYLIFMSFLLHPVLSADSWRTRRSNNWLVNQRRKARKQKVRYCAGLLGIIVFVAVLVLVMIWGGRHHWWSDDPLTFP